MSTQPNLDVSLWERFTDGLGAFSEGVVNLLGRWFGSSNERLVRSLGFIRPKGRETHTVAPGSVLDQVNSLEETMKQLRDDEFEQLTVYFRGRLSVEHKPFPKKTAAGSLTISPDSFPSTRKSSSGPVEKYVLPCRSALIHAGIENGPPMNA